MARFVGLDVSQKLTSICVVDETGARLWRGQCATDPEQIARVIGGHAGEDAKLGIRGLLKTFGLLPGAMRGLPFDRRVEALLADRDDLPPIARPMLAA